MSFRVIDLIRVIHVIRVIRVKLELETWNLKHEIRNQQLKQSPTEMSFRVIDLIRVIRVIRVKLELET